MHEVFYYRDRRGKQPVREFIDGLAAGNSKSDRIHSQKISEYIETLEAGKINDLIKTQKVKHLDGEIWELRPLDNRILFFTYHNDQYILLHHFYKQTQKTPAREIETAKRRMFDFMESAKGQRQ